MDEYGSWSRYASFGKESVLASFTLLEPEEEPLCLTEADMQQIRENVSENFVKLAQMHPDTTFYLFFPPYSICYWEAMVRTKQLNAQLEAQKIGADILLDVPNIQVYDFSFRLDIAENLDNYTDTLHYGEWINSEILQMIAAGQGRLMKENLAEYYGSVEKMYLEYDYTQYRE